MFAAMLTMIFLLELTRLTFFKLPQLYLLEAASDKKDIERIKTAFNSKLHELEVVNYDNAAWNDTYNYINNRNANFIKNNYVLDAFKRINLNGIHLYDIQGVLVWGKSFDRTLWQKTYFEPFDSPNEFVETHILINSEQVKANDNKPITHSGYTVLNNKLVMFAATSIFKANLTGTSNGTMVFWRVVNNDVLIDLQNRAGIKFDIEIVKNVLKNTAKKISKNTYIKGSYRNKNQLISDQYPLVSQNSRIHFTYKAPTRLFSVNWFNSSTMTTSFFFSLTLIFVFILIHKVVISPILRADHMVEKVIKHDKKIKFSTSRKDELGTLFNLIDRLLEDVYSKEQELQSHNVRLQKLSTTDSLTNIANRRSFDEYMHQLLTFNSTSSQVSLIVCDVDFFKRYNDFYGHALGDNTLKQIAQCLVNNLHSNTDFVARYGGEEFVIILNETSEHQAVSVANNLLQAVRDLNIVHHMSDISDVVTISIGIHTFDKSHHKNYEALFNKADNALYKAKEKGRNQLCLSSTINDFSP